MNMDGLNGLAGIGHCKSHSKHVARKTIVTSGGAKLIVEGVPVPGALLNRFALADPGILGIRAWPKKLQIIGS